MSQALEIQRCKLPKALQNQNIQKSEVEFSFLQKLEVQKKNLPHHLELVVYLTQIQDDHLNDPESNHSYLLQGQDLQQGRKGFQA